LLKSAVSASGVSVPFKKFNVLVIGYGSIGRRHVEILNRMEGVQRIELVTKQDINEYKIYKTLEQVPNLQDFDYFVVASETHKHFDQLVQLDKALHQKTILVEKPLYHCFYPRKDISNKVFVAYNLRFHPVLQELKRKIVGTKVLSANIMVGQYLPDWRPDRDYRKSYSADVEKGGGVLLDLSHEIDYIQWLFGRLQKLAAISQKISNLEISSDDYMSLIGRTVNGTYVTLTMDYLSKIPLRQIVIQTQKRTYIADLVRNTLKQSSHTSELGEDILVDVCRNTTYLGMHRAILNGETKDISSYEDGIRTMKIIEDIRLSSKYLGWDEN
jgi:predicted dehydrogenase